VLALGKTLSELLRDEERRRRYGLAAAALARSRHSWDITAARVAEVYADVFARHPDRERVAS
jgi:glycosyltransferase involved in cell wall biosynthesis